MLFHRAWQHVTRHLARAATVNCLETYKMTSLSSSSSSSSNKLVIVRNVPPEDYLSLSFVYGHAELRMKERKFNFMRRRSEPLAVVKIRIAANIQKEIDKKIKRIKSKKMKTSAASSEDVAAQPDMVALDESNANPDNGSLTVELFADDVQVDGGTQCADAFLEGSRLQVGQASYVVTVNPPTIKSIALPLNLMTGFAVRPKLDVEFTRADNCLFDWYRSSSATGASESDAKEIIPPPEVVDLWEPLVSSSQEYTPSIEDVGRVLKVVCTPTGTKWCPTGEPSEAVSKSAVVAGPVNCPFEDRHLHTSALLQGPGCFRCVSYNVLADLYADSDFSRQVLFPYCPPHALAADYRTQLLVKEISGYNSDVVCLQEVDEKLFRNCLSPVLSSATMEGIFHLKGGQVAEGLACFYRTTKLRLVRSTSIVLADEVQSNPLFAHYMKTLDKNEKLKETFMQRTTILQVTLLEFVEDPSRVLVVGNTHLYFRPDRDNIRLLQAGMCVEYLEQLVATERCIRNADAKVAAMLCGDFNSSPPFGVYQLMTTQFVQEDHADWSSNEDEIVQDLSLHHSLQLSSACGQPEFTNFTVGFAACIDYIFIDAGLLKTSLAVPMPSEAQLREHTALPSVTMPSDHVALVADVGWIDSKLD